MITHDFPPRFDYQIVQQWNLSFFRSHISCLVVRDIFKTILGMMIPHDKHIFQGWNMLNHQPVINQSLSSLFPQLYHIYPVIFSVISDVTTTISLGANNHQTESKMPIQAVILFFVSSFLYHQPVIFWWLPGGAPSSDSDVCGLITPRIV